MSELNPICIFPLLTITLKHLLSWYPTTFVPHSSIHSLLDFSRNKPSLLIEIILSLGFWCHVTPFEVTIVVTPQPIAECLWNIHGFCWFYLPSFSRYSHAIYLLLTLQIHTFSWVLYSYLTVHLKFWLGHIIISNQLIYSELNFMTSPHTQAYLFYGLLHLTNGLTFIIILKSVFQESLQFTP